MPDLSQWNIDNVKNIRDMLRGCKLSSRYPYFLIWKKFQMKNNENIYFEINYNPGEKNNKKVRIFGKKFIQNESYMCKIIFSNDIYDLVEYFEDIDNYYNHKDPLKFILSINKNITDLSYIFKDCESLISLIEVPQNFAFQKEPPSININYDSISDNNDSINNIIFNIEHSEYSKTITDISRVNESSDSFGVNEIIKNNFKFFPSKFNKIKNMCYMFYGCKSLTIIPDLWIFDVSEVVKINHLFGVCKSLKSLPGLSSWNISNVKSMNNLFYGCESLKELPDLAQWSTSNVNDLSCMFDGCKSLISLPDLSKWKILNVKCIHKLFNGCESLISLPDISEWNISKVEDMNSMFNGCESLISLPNISKWEVSNINNMNSLFNECKSLISLPNLSKWNIDNVTDMRLMFKNCGSLISLPDISKWNTKNVKDIGEMFNYCSSLISFPNLSNWNTSQIKFDDSKTITKGCINSINFYLLKNK